MDISHDSAKDRRNVLIRGISFELVHFFDWTTAAIIEDVRRDYGERRFIATGPIAGRLHVVVFTLRANRAHVISRELRHHETEVSEATNLPDAD